MLALLTLVGLAWSPSTLVFVRHGETEANATGHYNSRTLNSFSKIGQEEVSRLTKQLVSEPRFDRILVSPSPRALRTIAPYLAATHQRAVVWPLLYECCTGRRPKDALATRFGYGEKIRLPSDMAAYFSLMPGEDRLPVASDYNAGLAQVAASLREFRRRFSRGRVLLVGHSGQGGHFLHDLTGRWRRVENAKEIVVQLGS